ncbi:unnamed protein product [Protopolystoma xenopodis]|uniref:Uncharacterized protein n=1 Tax=Protopolystoma xenopodis TaxID=117903 RepID=A0A3S5FFF9_9PLAT|nr:unnamed protein product [Protopolystoma xenopodis]
MVLRMARLTDDANYDAGEMSEKVSNPGSNFGNNQAYNALRTRYVPQSLSTNVTKLRKQGQTTSIKYELTNYVDQIEL